MREAVLYLAVHDPHVPLTGSGARGGELVRGLAERFDVDLVYLEGSGQPPLPGLQEAYAARLSGVRRKIRIGFSRLRYFLFSWQFHQAARRLLRENEYRYVICDYGIAALYGLLLRWEFRVPFIYSSHNVEYQGCLDKARTDLRRLLLLPYVYCIERLGVRMCAVLVAIVAGDAEFFSRWTDPGKILVLPQGVDVAVFNPFYEPPRNDSKVVLFCGNFGIPFNRDVVRVVRDQILEPVLESCPGTRFRFVGALPPADVEHPNIEFTGFATDYPSLLQQADAVISPMLYGHGFPTKIVEALACGKPLISTAVGARGLARDYDGMRICELPEFAAAICEVLREDRPLRAENFAKVRDRYAWGQHIERLSERILSVPRRARSAGE